jgi:hypothetical protein
VQKSGTRGTGLPNSYSRFALIAACRADARAKIVITALIVTLIRFGSVMVGCAGQMMRTMAGMPSGSTSSTLRWSWLTWPDANGVMGEDGDMAELAFRLGPGGCSLHAIGADLCG